MTLVRWDPIREMMQLHRSLRQISPQTASTEATPDAEESTATIAAWEPSVDIVETEEAFLLSAELPGIDREAIELNVEDNTLKLSGERVDRTTTDSVQSFRRERFYGRFQRSFKLPKTVDPESICANYRDGVLELMLPKLVAAKPRKIDINVA